MGDEWCKAIRRECSRGFKELVQIEKLKNGDQGRDLNQTIEKLKESEKREQKLQERIPKFKE